MPEIGISILKVLISLIMLVSLISLIIPVIPGLTVMWAAAIIYAIFAGFNWFSITMLVFITLLMLGGNLGDNVIAGASAKQKGASFLSIILSFLIMLIGPFFITPFGAFLIALLVLIIIEWIRIKDLKKALEALWGMILGQGLAFVGRFVMGLAIVFWWVIWAFFSTPILDFFNGLFT